MDLIEVRKNLLMLGMSLNFTLRDESGSILLAKGHRIETTQQLEGLRSRHKIFVEIDESEEGIRAMMEGITTLNNIGAPIKDFSKHLKLNLGDSDDKLTGSLSERWGEVESKLAGLLASVSTTADFEKKIRLLDKHIQSLLAENKSASQFLLFNRAVTHFNGYSVMHSLLCASLVHLLAPFFNLTEEQRGSLVCAALTMNVAMTRLQDILAAQKSEPNPAQRSEIDSHTTVGKQILQAAKVSDDRWLELVERHHAHLHGPESLADWEPVPRMTKILQTVDRYTAGMSPRKSRSGRTARESVLSVVVKAGASKHDEVGTALVRILGVSPPGTYVKLVNGETAVVIRRGIKPGEPLVAAVLNRNDEPIAEPRLHDTSREKLLVKHTLVASEVRVSIKIDAMLRLIPKQDATAL
ncbi:HD-GYP domain-containing protein [Rhodoferax lacus]|nr:phosphodiesterase [Rhodoferax lacus]